MGRIEHIFAGLKSSGRKGLMPFVCGGHPAPGLLPTLLPALEGAGASIVEVGFPFSDPIADGPVIAAAMHEALGRGCTPGTVLGEIAAARPRTSLGIVAMVSVSIVWRVGVAEMVAMANGAGIDGFILPDLPADESDHVLGTIRDGGLSASLLVAPTSDERRAARIAAASSGFIYLLARAGITGESSGAPEIGPAVARLRGLTDLPIACGFGIATAEHVAAVTAHADAAIVGSAMVRRMSAAHAAGEDPVAAAAAFTRELSLAAAPRL